MQGQSHENDTSGRGRYSSKEAEDNNRDVRHDQVEAMTMADRIVVLHGSSVGQIGTPWHVKNASESFYGIVDLIIVMIS